MASDFRHLKVLALGGLDMDSESETVALLEVIRRLGSQLEVLRLPDLWFNAIDSVESTMAINSIMRAISLQCTNLETLEIPISDMTDEGLSEFRSSTSHRLRYLYLRGRTSNLTADSISAILECTPQLTDIRL
jgi:hypothetical protein